MDKLVYNIGLGTIVVTVLTLGVLLLRLLILIGCYTFLFMLDHPIISSIIALAVAGGLFLLPDQKK